MDINPATQAIGRPHRITLTAVLTVAVIASAGGCGTTTISARDTRVPPAATRPSAEVTPAALVVERQRVFCFDTLGDGRRPRAARHAKRDPQWRPSAWRNS